MKFLAALLVGALLALAFAPFHVYSFAFISPAILLALWQTSSPKKAFMLGLLFGIGFFGVGASWIYISIHNFGNANVFLSTFITFLFVFALALYIATLGYVFRILFSRYSDTVNFLLIFPILWVLWEFLRSTQHPQYWKY